MKRSIASKLFISITLLIVFIIGISWIIHTQYLEKYYLDNKKEDLYKYGMELKDIYGKSQQDLYNRIEYIEDATSSEVMIFDINGLMEYGPTINRPGMGRNSRLGMMGIFNKRLLSQIIEDEVAFQFYEHPVLSTQFMLYGFRLNPEKILIIQSSVSSISDSAKIAQDFYIYIGIISLIIGTIVAYLLSRAISTPIIRLNNVATEMSKLNFKHKYIVKSNDEIGDLGTTLNYLSEQLDNTITSLNKANKKLKADIEKEKELDNMRKEFISTVSHELKTPIALVSGYAEGLKDNIVDNKEDREFYCEVIMEESNKMKNLVDDLLDISQMESGQFTLNKRLFDLSWLVNKVVDKYRPIFRERDINIKDEIVGNTFDVYGDPERIEQVLINFVNNSINHVDDKKIIQIKVQEFVDKVAVTIFNTGELIPEEEIYKIWDSFYRIDKSRSRKYGGTGLGLSIVSNILKLHNSIFGVNNLEDGVEFWFEIKKSEGEQFSIDNKNH